MIVNKITTGFVIQKFDTATRQFVAQDFIAGDQVDFENEHGDTVEPFDNYLPFEMKQPVKDVSALDQSERLAAVEQFVIHPSDEEWAKLRNVILSDHPLRVVVTIEGGNYQGAVATGPIDLAVLDYDNWEACDEGHEEEAEYYANLEAEVERLKSIPTTTLL